MYLGHIFVLCASLAQSSGRKPSRNISKWEIHENISLKIFVFVSYHFFSKVRKIILERILIPKYTSQFSQIVITRKIFQVLTREKRASCKVLERVEESMSLSLHTWGKCHHSSQMKSAFL